MARIPMLDMFSGIGGFSYALREVTETIAYCEIDAKCQEVILKNIVAGRLDDAPVFPDVTKLSCRDLKRKPAMITAGFPCQDIAISNPNGLGLQGMRSKMVYEVFRIADEVKQVKCIFLENSPALRIKGLATIMQELIKRRFTCSWGIFSAGEVGAPQIRKRMFILATRDSFKPPEISLQKLRFGQSWKKEIVPRVLPRTTTEKGSTIWNALIKRNRMLGNGIVPQTVVFAYYSLVAALKGTLPKCDQPSDKGILQQLMVLTPIEQNKILERRYLRAASGRSMPVTDVIMKDGSTEYRKTFWNTPCASPLYYAYSRLTPRSQFLLANELFYEVRTRDYIKSLGEVNFSELHKRWTINPNWIEWLMGYPQNYTKTRIK